MKSMSTKLGSVRGITAGAVVGVMALLASQTMADTPAAPSAPPQEMVNQYAQGCSTQTVNRPPPGGEGDLKDNPKLQAYCQCFATKFATRAMAAVQAGALNPGAPRPAASELFKQEHEMRNSCRQQLGLPLLNFPTK